MGRSEAVKCRKTSMGVFVQEHLQEPIQLTEMSIKETDMESHIYFEMLYSMFGFVSTLFHVHTMCKALF